MVLGRERNHACAASAMLRPVRSANSFDGCDDARGPLRCGTRRRTESIFCGVGTGRLVIFFLEGPATSAADQRHSLSRSALEVVIEARVDGDAANRLLPRYR
jgi:hypothetical protein